MENLTTCGKLVKNTRSEEETRNLGRELAKTIKGSQNLFLWGELGAGKTTLLKGFGEGLGIKSKEIISPSFQLVRKYEGKKGRLIHIDLYRLKDIIDILHLGWWELLEEDGVTAIEWADRAREIWPEQGVFIHLETVSETERTITIYNEKKNIPWH